MAHSEVRVVKQARQQIAKAVDWIRPLVDVEEIDPEVVELALARLEDLDDALTNYLEL